MMLAVSVNRRSTSRSISISSSNLITEKNKLIVVVVEDKILCLQALKYFVFFSVIGFLIIKIDIFFSRKIIIT